MNFFLNDENLQHVLKQSWNEPFQKWAFPKLENYGAMCAHDIDERAAYTDRDGRPVLIKYDKMGRDISYVRLNEGYLKTVRDTYSTGIVGFVHKQIPELGVPGDYTYSFALGYLLSQAEPGFYCPVTLTMATAYLIDHYADDQLKAKYLPHVLSTGEVDLFEGATFLTERQGGSDVGANEVKAVKEGDVYHLYGEKYFASNAGACGVAMVLARVEGAPKGTKGLSLFLVPWRGGDGQLNGIQIRRLKDKLGVRAVPSAEVEFAGAEGYLVGEADRGFYYMMEALNLSRICNAVASIGIMRRSVTESLAYAKEREAFGGRLIDYPMIQDTLSTMTVKQEVETRAVFHMIRAFDRMVHASEHRPEEEVLTRLRIAVLKKESAEQAVHFAQEAIELHGGNGYIEDFVTPRLLRDAQVLTVWEGTANILGLEVLRLFHKYQAHQLFYDELKARMDVLEKDEDVRAVDEYLEDFHEESRRMMQMKEREQTFYSKRLAKKMALLYEGVTALEMKREGGRTAKAASLYLHLHFHRESNLENPLVLQYADDLLYRTAVKP
ncbi:acyl-CoA dehydrogenase family protein [Halobacillus kuroshimensis]|uniref:Acyl-CoA dehydrogenase family protein n=1 Tax=Halobacillus kuroshimensis TaxID=302481 RepID=A0ABS3DVM4_9BACI|nr:acyl-CoA dehydrogenase family protein [Halobacillus kuroshimensis]MBN8235396.1 acyl-CoA dehydrogenase family protein [Halobacillus kuroshimensis]